MPALGRCRNRRRRAAGRVRSLVGQERRLLSISSISPMLGGFARCRYADAVIPDPEMT
jgi:hypothetical protein